MSIQLSSITNALSKSLATSPPGGSAAARSFERTQSESLPQLKAEPLTKHMCEVLKIEGKPAAAAYITTFSKSAQLDAQLGLLESGVYVPEQVSRMGMVPMIDALRTTPELLEQGLVVMTEEAHTSLLASLNELAFTANQHINHQAATVAEQIATQIKPQTRFARFANLFTGRSEVNPLELIHPLPEEWERLEQLSQYSFTDVPAMQEAFQRTLTGMFRQRPAMFGYETTASLVRYVRQGLIPDISGEPRIGDPINLSRIRHLHSFMTNQGMRELQIPGSYAPAITSSITTEAEAIFGDLTVAETTEARLNMPWLEEPLAQKNVERLALVPIIDSEVIDLVNLTPEELAQLQNVSNKFDEFAHNTFTTPLTDRSQSALLNESFTTDEQDATKLLLRIGIKLGAKLATAVIESIAKDPDTSPEMKHMLGVLLSFTKGGSVFVDKVITGEEKPNLEQDCVQCIRGVLGLE